MRSVHKLLWSGLAVQWERLELWRRGDPPPTARVPRPGVPRALGGCWFGGLGVLQVGAAAVCASRARGGGGVSIVAVTVVARDLGSMWTLNVG